jgi:hypothetical protein
MRSDGRPNRVSRPAGAARWRGLAALAFALALPALTGPGCGDGPDRRCAERCQCKERGKCGQKRGQCVATEEKHCRQSELCRLFGRCSLQGNECVAASDADCKGSEQCVQVGKCIAKAGGCVR